MRFPSLLIPLTMLALGACASTSDSVDSKSSSSSSSGAASKGAGSQGASMASSNGTSDRNASGQDTSSATSCGSCATSTAPGTSSSDWGTERCWGRGYGEGYYPTNLDAVCTVKCQTAESGAAPVTVDLRLARNDFSGDHIVHVDQEGTPGIHREWRTSAVPGAPNWTFRDLTPDGGVYPDGQGEFHLQVQWAFAGDAGPIEDNLQVWSDPARTAQVVNSQAPALRCTMRSN